jgi:hypothetical protein
MRGEAVGEAGHFWKKKIPSQITSFNPSRGRSYKEYQICCVFKRKILVSRNRGMPSLQATQTIGVVAVQGPADLTGLM